MIGYIVKSVDGVSVQNTIGGRLSQDESQIIVKFEIDLNNLNSFLKVDLVTLAKAIGLAVSMSHTKAAIIAKIENTVKTRDEMRAYISANTLLWNAPLPEDYPEP
jgi:hypothetical protein